MQQEEAIREALSLANRSRIAMLGTNGDDGYPNIKAMLKMENEDLKIICGTPKPVFTLSILTSLKD